MALYAIPVEKVRKYGINGIGKIQKGSLMTVKLTTKAACRVAGIDRDRLNEYISAGTYPCAPATTHGRARLFDPDDMLGLRLFRELMDDSYSPKVAGPIACAVALAARIQPDVRVMAYVEFYIGSAEVHPYETVLSWGDLDRVILSGRDIRKVTLFNIGKQRDMIAHFTEEERSIIGEDGE